METEEQSSTSRWSLRFSILNILLAMAIVGCGITIWQLWREVGPLRAEVVQLRNETGRLSIDDPTKIHAIEVRTSEPLLWKWRVWVPQGQNVLARYHFGSMPSSGVPPASGSLQLKPGENWVTLRAHSSPSGKSWSARLETANSYVGHGIQEPDRWWQWPFTSSTDSGIGFTTEVVRDRDPTLVLKSVRVSPSRISNRSLPPAAYTSGFIIWLERH